MSDSYRYKAFISYSHEDKKLAKWLHRRLESYRTPASLNITTALKPIFRDEEELAASRDLSASIVTALNDSQSLIVICSPSAARSRWVNEEIKTFQALGRDDQIFCFIVDGEPNDPDNECIPNALRQEGGAEPLAADCRNNGKKAAALSLIAGMLGVGIDHLIQREANRRQRRLLIITGASLAGMVLAFVLATIAYLASQEAQRQSTTARKTTEFLAELYNAANPTKNQGKQTSPEQLLNEGVARVEELNDQPALQAELLHSIGNAFLSLGSYETARELLQRAERIREALGEYAKLVQTLNRLGELYQSTSEYDKSERAYLRALELIEELALSEKLDTQSQGSYRMNILSSYGQTLAQAGRYDDAIGRLQEVVDYYQDDSQLEVQDRNFLAITHGSLGTVYRQQDQLENAEYHFRLAIDFAKQNDNASNWAGLINNLSVIVKRLGRLEEAELLYRESAELTEKIFGTEHPKYAFVLNNLSMLLRDREKYAEALELQNQAYISLLETLGGEHPATLVLHSNLGLLNFDLGDIVGSERIQRGVLAKRRARQIGDHEDTAESLVRLAEVLVHAGRLEDAAEYAEEGYVMTASLFGEQNSKTAWAKVIQGEVLLGLGSMESRELIETGCARIVEVMGEHSGDAQRCQRKLRISN